MKTTIERNSNLDQLINDFISQEGLKKTIYNLDELFYYFITTIDNDAYIEEKETISLNYKVIKDFLISIKVDEKGITLLNETSSLNEIFEKLLKFDNLKTIINALNDMFFFYVVNAYDEHGKDYGNSISWSYKFIKDFLTSLVPYEIILKEEDVF